MFGWFFYAYHISNAWIADASTKQPIPRASTRNVASASSPAKSKGSLSWEEQEEIVKEDHRFLNVLKKKVEGHELALRKQEESKVREREDYLSLVAGLGKLLNRTKEEFANKLMILEGKQLRADKKEKQFESKVSTNERLMLRQVRLGELQLAQMERWIGDVVTEVQRNNERAFALLKDKVVEALLAFSAKEGKEETEDADGGGGSTGSGQRRRHSSLPSPPALLAVIEEITSGEIFTIGDKHADPPALLEEIVRKKAALLGARTTTAGETDQGWAKAGVVAVATRDFSAASDDELSFREGDELLVVNAVPSDVWWRVKNGEGKEGLVPSSHLKWYDEDGDEYVVLGGRWEEEGAEAEVGRRLKEKEEEIRKLEEENARLRFLKGFPGGTLLQTAVEGDGKGGGGGGGRGDNEDGSEEEPLTARERKKRALLLERFILPEARKILKGFEGGDEEWEEMERRRYVWKDWRQDSHDLHSLHLYNGLRPDPDPEQSEERDPNGGYHWRKTGRHGMRHHIQILLETDAWKREAEGRFLAYQPPPGREWDEDGGFNHQVLALMEALAWAKLLERTLVVPLFGDGSSENYYHPNAVAGVYLNTTALQDYAPVASWKGFLNAFVGDKEAQDKLKASDLKDRLVDMVNDQVARPKTVVYLPKAATVPAPPAASKKKPGTPSAPDTASRGDSKAANEDNVGRKGKLIQLKGSLKTQDGADVGNLHTSMIKLKAPMMITKEESRNYYLKSQGLSIAGVEEVDWGHAHQTPAVSDEERIVQTFGRGEYGKRELMVFSSLYGFYDIPRPFLHALLHAALRFPTPLVDKALEYVAALSEDGSAPYAAVHLRRSDRYRSYCRAVKEREVDHRKEEAANDNAGVRIEDKALVFDRCYTAMEDVIKRLTAIHEVGNYSRIFVATDLAAQDPEDVLLGDLPWVTKLNEASAQALFPSKFDANHFATVEMVVCAHAELFVGNLYSAFSQMTTHYRHVLGQPSHTSLFL